MKVVSTVGSMAVMKADQKVELKDVMMVEK